MRNIRKKLNVKYLEVVVYNTTTKEEETTYTAVSEIEKDVTLPEGCVKISEKIIEEKEVVYKMTPEQFIKYAEIEK